MSEISNETTKATHPASSIDTSARASEDGRLVDDRSLTQFHYPVPRKHTGRLQYRIDRAESVTIDRIGDVRRGGVVAVKNENFARGLTISGNFANAPADAPLGQPEKYKPQPKAPVIVEDVNLATAPPKAEALGTLETTLRRVEANNAAGKPNSDSDMSALLSEVAQSPSAADPTPRGTRK